MRIAMILPVLMLGACQMSKDDANDTITVEINGEVAENAAEDFGNTAGNIASDVGNEAARAGNAIENEVGDVDVDVDVSRNAPANSN